MSCPVFPEKKLRTACAARSPSPQRLAGRGEARGGGNGTDVDGLSLGEGRLRLGRPIKPEQRLAAQQQGHEAMPRAQAVPGLVEAPQRFFRIALAEGQMGQPEAKFRQVAFAFRHQVFVSVLGLVQEPLVVDCPSR